MTTYHCRPPGRCTSSCHCTNPACPYPTLWRRQRRISKFVFYFSSCAMLTSLILYSISHRNNLSNCCNQRTCLKVSTTHNICWDDHDSQTAQNGFSRISGTYPSLRLWWSHKVACWWNNLNLPSPDHCLSTLAFDCRKLGVCKPRMGWGLYLPKCSYQAWRWDI